MVKEDEIKKQILEAVDCLYLVELNNDTFGFTKVSIADMIAHLCTNCGPLTCSNLEVSCASIAIMWTPDNPIEMLWECLHEVQHISICTRWSIDQCAIHNLTLIMFEMTSVFTTT